MEYKIIDAFDKVQLEKLVNEHINEWEPSGGVCCVYENETSEFYFFQAMIRRNLEPPVPN